MTLAPEETGLKNISLRNQKKASWSGTIDFE
jgi:hypothetical protein